MAIPVAFCANSTSSNRWGSALVQLVLRPRFPQTDQHLNDLAKGFLSVQSYWPGDELFELSDVRARGALQGESPGPDHRL
jgi:hypothetical protein